MVKNIRRVHAPAYKARVALEALKETKTIAEIASTYHVHTTQIVKWKKQALDILSQGFTTGKQKKREKDERELIQELYRQIGKLKVETDFLKKKMGLFEN
jgi:transposase